MPRKRKESINGIEEKLEYLELDLENIPESLKRFEALNYRLPRISDEKQYRQYRYVPVDKIQILISPTNRLDDIKEKYSKASPLADYLEPDENNERKQHDYETFIKMLEEVKIEEIEKIEKEQQTINKKIPFKVRYSGNVQIVQGKKLIDEYSLAGKVVAGNNFCVDRQKIKTDNIKEAGEYTLRMVLSYFDENGKRKNIKKEANLNITGKV